MGSSVWDLVEVGTHSYLVVIPTMRRRCINLLVLVILFPFLLATDRETLVISKKTGAWAKHYQGVMDTIADQDRLLEVQRTRYRPRHYPIFLTLYPYRRSRRMPDEEIFYYGDTEKIVLEKCDNVSLTSHTLSQGLCTNLYSHTNLW